MTELLKTSLIIKLFNLDETKIIEKVNIFTFDGIGTIHDIFTYYEKNYAYSDILLFIYYYIDKRFNFEFIKYESDIKYLDVKLFNYHFELIQCGLYYLFKYKAVNILDILILIYKKDEVFINYIINYILIHNCTDYNKYVFIYTIESIDKLLNYNLLYYKLNYLYFNNKNGYFLSDAIIKFQNKCTITSVFFLNYRKEKIIINKNIINLDLYKWSYNRRIWIYLSIINYNI